MDTVATKLPLDRNHCFKPLRWTSLFLELLSIKVLDKPRPKFAPAVIIYYVTMSTIFGLIMSAIYAHPHETIHFAVIGPSIALFVSRRAINRSASLIRAQLNRIFDVLTTDQIKIVSAMDKRLIAIIAITFILQVAMQIIHTLATRTCTLTPLFSAYKPSQDDLICALSDSLLYIILFYSFTGTYAPVCYYIMTQYVCLQHADLCRIHFAAERTSNRIRFNRIRANYLFHNDSKRIINHNLSLVPFLMFCSTFMIFAATLAFMIVIATMQMDFFFSMCLIGITVAVVITLTMVSICSRATEAFDEARNHLLQLACGCDAPLDDRHRLTTMLTNDSTVAASAWNMFDVDRSVLLGFANAVVTFTVMIATSAKSDCH